MNYWLFKSEPDEYSIDDLSLEPIQIGRWDGIRNYQARNLLRDKVQLGDGVLFYHSSCKVPAVVGSASVSKAAYPDPTQFDPQSRYFDTKSTLDKPRWFCVDIRFSAKFSNPLSLKQIKSQPGLEDMILVKQGRLSIQPVSSSQWHTIVGLCQP